MLPGCTIIRKCSACAGPIEEQTIESGNTIGAKHWTDGKLEAPMLPDMFWLVICPHCHAPLWLDEIEEIETLEIFELWSESLESRYPNISIYKSPSVHDYFAILARHVASPKKTRYLRLRAWRAGNDARRNNKNEVKISVYEKSNLIALAGILDETNDNDLLMKAEVMRELSRFADAKALLAKVSESGHSQAFKIIKGLTEKHDPYVREMSIK